MNSFRSMGRASRARRLVRDGAVLERGYGRGAAELGPWGVRCILRPAQTSGVRPGIATGATGSGPISYVGGRRSSFDAFIAQSHFSARPV